MRAEFSKKTKRQAQKQALICAWCSMPFERAYIISATRSSKPQLCSRKCQAAFRSRAAENELQNRFWIRVDKKGSDECWPWIGRLNQNGYGILDVGGRPKIASRVSYEIAFGPFETGKFICHKCDNPKCVNPSHLWVGTHQQNVDDAKQKGRVSGGNGLKGSAVNTSKLSVEQALENKRSSTPAKILAGKFGVSATAIYLIRSGKNWGWLDV